jgi:hypothetical protein
MKRRPKATGHHVEYLVVMRVSDGMTPTLSRLGLVVNGNNIELTLRDVTCVFRRSGEVGGSIISYTANGKLIKHDLCHVSDSIFYQRVRQVILACP